MNELDPSFHLNPLTSQVDEAILLLNRTWPFYETAMRDLLIRESGMTLDIASIILGRMEARTILERLLAIAKHRKDSAQTQSISILSKSHAQFSKIRNTIAHNVALGVSKKDPTLACFLKHQFVQSSPRFVQVEWISIKRIAAAARFASNESEAMFWSMMSGQQKQEALRMREAMRPTHQE